MTGIDRFFDRWVELHPEEASTLGIHRGVLSDPSWEAIEAEARELGDVREDGTEDGAAALAWAKHERRKVETGEHLANVELGLLPYHLLRHFALHEPESPLVAARARAIPAFLAAHERTLARGAREGRAVAASTHAWLTSRTIPTMSAALRALGHDDAAEAYARHGAFLAEHVRTRPSGAIGRDATVFRLREVMGIDRSPEDLIAEAREALAGAHRGFLDCARRVLGGEHDVASARAAMLERMKRPYVDRDDQVIPALAALTLRATEFARAHGLVPIEGALDVEVAPMPPAIAEAGDAQNWAAPLLAARPRAHFLASTNHARHPAIAAPLLAVHEGVPGHSLQSLCFARAHGRSRAPAMFLAVADDVAMARANFRAMLSIEGWATWVEHRMLELGFYEGEEELFAWSVRAIRAARVIADLSLHAELLDLEECVQVMMREGTMGEPLARTEVARYQRAPLQAITYLTGALAIDRALARGVKISAVLDAPIPPDRLTA